MIIHRINGFAIEIKGYKNLQGSRGCTLKAGELAGFNAYTIDLACISRASNTWKDC
jgi:hypothetical protein